MCFREYSHLHSTQAITRFSFLSKEQVTWSISFGSNSFSPHWHSQAPWIYVSTKSIGSFHVFSTSIKTRVALFIDCTDNSISDTIFSGILGVVAHAHNYKLVPTSKALLDLIIKIILKLIII